MKILDHCVIYTTDDEEPDCMMCDYCQGNDLCSECITGSPEHWWRYYRREEQNSEMSKLIRALENLGFEKSKRRFK